MKSVLMKVKLETSRWEQNLACAYILIISFEKTSRNKVIFKNIFFSVY